jgi:hypothetical protein
MPFVLLLALLLVVVALVFVRPRTGRPRLSEPYCAKCGYDVRTQLLRGEDAPICPECGTDLTGPAAVNFGRVASGGRRAAVIGLLAVTAVIGLGLFGLFGRSVGLRPTGPNGVTGKSNAVLIAELPQFGANTPWHWQELQRRLSAGQLTPAEAAAAIDGLIAVADANLKARGPQPLHWSDTFLQAAEASGAVSTEQFAALSKAFYGPDPRVRVDAKLRADSETVQLGIEWGGPWRLPGDRPPVMALRGVALADGTPLTVYSTQGRQNRDPDLLSNGHGNLNALVAGPLKPGSYDLVCTFDLGVLPKGTPLVGTAGLPGQAGRWIKPLVTWQSTVKVPVVVIDPAARPLEAVTDPSSDPVRVGGLTPPTLRVRREVNGISISAEFPPATPGVPVIADVVLRFPREVPPYSRGMTLSAYNPGEKRVYLAGFTLPSDVESADVILKPQPDRARQDLDIDRYWAKEIIFENVPLERHDRPTTEPAVPTRPM